MNKNKSLPKEKVYSFSYVKKSKNEINDFYSEWEKFQKVVQPASSNYTSIKRKIFNKNENT
jgi:hypothetical protein